MPGSAVLIFALIGTGDLAAAESACAAALAQCRDTGDMNKPAGVLSLMADLDVRTGRFQDAAAHLREGLQVVLRTGDLAETANCLWSCALLCTATGRYAEAATVWAPGTPGTGFIGGSPEDARREVEALAKIRQALGPGRVRAAEERGAAMSLDTAAEYALMLTAPAPAAAAGAGLGRLSARERELVTLVAQGRTNTQIAGAAVHQRPHRRLASGPDPGQDRLPPPRRPDPPGPDRGPGLAAARLPGPGNQAMAPVGHLTPAARKGSAGLCRAHARAREPAGTGRESRPDPSRRTTIMITQRSHHRSRPWMATRQAGARLGRLATLLAAVISGLLASAAIVPAAFAQPIPIGDDGAPTTPVPPATVRVITTGGMAGWQIALIALGAALVAAAAAVLLDRKLAGRRGRHRLMRPPVTAHHACLTTGPGPGPSGRPAFALRKCPASRDGPDAMIFGCHCDASAGSCWVTLGHDLWLGQHARSPNVWVSG